MAKQSDLKKAISKVSKKVTKAVTKKNPKGYDPNHIVKKTGEAPEGNFNFKVEITAPKLGPIEIGFQSISGIGVTANFKEYREGGNNYIPDKLLDYVSDTPATFMTGITQNEAIMDLMYFYFRGGKQAGSFSQLFDIKVYLKDRSGKYNVRSYQLIGCQFESFTLGDLDALGESFAVESFSVRYNEFRHHNGKKQVSYKKKGNGAIE